MLLLELSTVYIAGAWVASGVSTLQFCAAPGIVYTTGAWAAYDVSTLQRPVLLLELSTPQGPELHLTCLHYRGLSYSWSCLYHRSLSCIWRVYPTEACAAPGVVYTTGAWAASDRDVSTLPRPVLLLELSTVHHRGLSCIWRVYTTKGLCCTWKWKFTQQWPEKHLDLSTLQLQMPVLHLDMSIPQHRGLSWKTGASAASERLHFTHMSCTWMCI